MVSLTSDLPLVLSIIVALIVAKWVAAELTGHAFGFDATDRLLTISLTLPQVAATLAAAIARPRESLRNRPGSVELRAGIAGCLVGMMSGIFSATFCSR